MPGIIAKRGAFILDVDQESDFLNLRDSVGTACMSISGKARLAGPFGPESRLYRPR